MRNPTAILQGAERRGERRKVGLAVNVVIHHKLGRIGAAMILLLVAAAVFGPFIAPYSAIVQDKTALLSPPSWQHWLGTDNLGRDQLTRILYGARVSLEVSMLSMVIAASVGVVLGLVAAHVGGVADTLIMRFMDAIIAFPSLLMAIVLVSVLGANLINIIFAIAFGQIPNYARVARAQALSIGSSDFVLAAHASGAGGWRVITRHIWPNATDPIIVAFAIGVAHAVLAEASLSFLGLGVRPPTPTWGMMLKTGFPFLETAPWVALVPGFAIFFTVLSFNIFGDALRDALDPRIRTGKQD